MALVPLAVKDANNATANQEMIQGLNGAGNNIPVVSLDSTRHSYRCSALFTPFATAPVTLFGLYGSATKTIRLQRIGLWMVATANASVGVTLARGGAIGTGGTAISPTITLHDTGAAAATALAKHFTTAAQSAAAGSTNITTANVTGNLVAETVQIFAPLPYTVLFPEAGIMGQALVLRGTAQCFEVQVNLGQSGGANGPPAAQIGYFMEWTEDAT